MLLLLFLLQSDALQIPKTFGGSESFDAPYEEDTYDLRKPSSKVILIS